MRLCEFSRRAIIASIGLLFVTTMAWSVEHTTARTVTYYGYDDCIRIENGTTSVTLCPAAGGRVLQYALRGVNALHLPPGSEGWTLSSGKPAPSMDAGRFDIGPEHIVPPRPRLWMGRWTAEITGPYSAKMTSVEDDSTGAQLTREFRLDPNTTRLTCTQTISNISERTNEYCHWSRTFAVGNGICVIPLSPFSRFPHGYVMYGPGPAINFRPEDPNIRRRGDYLEITGAPRYPKLGMDSTVGWFAYLMPNDLMFVKQYATFPDRVYNEVAGLTISIWYPDGPMCELEPIGPRERLAPGGSASFSETWWLLPRKFPAASSAVDANAVADQVEQALQL